jgi:hypothetical protein
LFSLGPDATPTAISDTIDAICKSGRFTEPTLSDSVHIQAFREGWQLAFDPAAGGQPCP